MSIADVATVRPFRNGVRVSVSSVCDRRSIFFPDSGAAVTIAGDSTAAPVLAYASDPRVAEVEQVGFDLGQGPAAQALAQHEPILITAWDESAQRRWPAYAAIARRQGWHGIYAFPMQSEGTTIGTFTLYSQAALPKREWRIAVALRMVDAATLSLAGARPGPGASLDSPVTEPGVQPGPPDPADGVQLERAIEMIMTQLRVPRGEATVRLRAYAWARDRQVSEIAGAVVGRSLVFDPAGPS